MAKIDKSVRLGDMPSARLATMALRAQHEKALQLGVLQDVLKAPNATASADLQERCARREAFENLKATVQKWWPAHWPLLKAQLGACATLQLKGIPHSIALFTMGESGSGKSMEIKAFTGSKHHERILRVDKFTPAALLSGFGESKKADLEKDALFRRVQQKVLVTPELSRLFRGRTVGVLEERFSELAGWLDGEGIVSVTGTHGFQGAEGDFTCVWLGCTTPFNLPTWRTMERLGQRLLFFPAANIPTDAEVPEEQLEAAVDELRAATRRVLDVLFGQRKLRTVKPWPARPKAIDQEINRLTDLLADGHVISAGLGSSEPAARPDVKHFRSRIREIVSGAVWVSGRTMADSSDIREIVRPIIERSMPQCRGPVLLALYDGLSTVKDIAERTGLSNMGVDRTLNELQRMEVVTSETTAPLMGAPAGRWMLARDERTDR